MGFLVTVHLSHDNENITSCNYQKMFQLWKQVLTSHQVSRKRVESGIEHFWYGINSTWINLSFKCIKHCSFACEVLLAGLYWVRSGHCTNNFFSIRKRKREFLTIPSRSCIVVIKVLKIIILSTNNSMNNDNIKIIILIISHNS